MKVLYMLLDKGQLILNLRQSVNKVCFNNSRIWGKDLACKINLRPDGFSCCLFYGSGSICIVESLFIVTSYVRS